MTRQLVPTKIAAQILGIHPETLRDWSRRALHGIPTPIRVGGRLRWDVAELLTWIEQQRTAS